MAKKSSRKTTAVASRLSFSIRSVLLRYVHDVQRLASKRAAPDVFRANPGERYLSVNLAGVESRAQIVSYYRELFQGNSGAVAICEHTVGQYNHACSDAGIGLTELPSRGWTFVDRDGSAANAYERHPRKPTDGSRPSPSHSGVEYVRVFDQLAENRFARRMSRKKFRSFNH
jgi:hypothetical protein